MIPVVSFWLSHGAEVAGLIQQHLLLVVLSTAVAVALGVPTGIVAARRPHLGRALVLFAHFGG